MSDGEDIRKAIKETIKNPANAFSQVCKVVAVSAGTLDGLMICDCEPLDGTPIIEDVRLVAHFDDSTTNAGFIAVPKVDSFVIVSYLNPSTAFVSMVSEVDALYLNGNTYGGLVKVVDLVTKLNNVENDLNTVKAAFAAWVVVPGDGGAALKAIAAAWAAATITPTVRANIENTEVTHGDGSLI